MNEAKLEAKISSVISKIFPTFKKAGVEHQNSFSLKVGHHNLTINSISPTRNTVRAIYDILFKIGEQNIMLLELKNENIKITDDDIAQGISYARLLDQMPPITLISNGHDNRLFKTYNREPIERDTLDLQYVLDTIDNNFTIALKDLRDAVDLLLNNDPELFSQIINNISAEKFNLLVGPIEDYEKPISEDFNIERTILRDIITGFEKNSVVGIQGAAFSGKTTLLYQFYHKIVAEKDFILFIDCNDQNYSIYRQLATAFNKSTNALVDSDQILKWLVSSLHTGSKERFYLLLDNFNKKIPETIMAEILELMDLFEGQKHRILFTIDEFNFKEFINVPHRKYKKMFGKKSKVLKINEFDDAEFNSALEKMATEFRLGIGHGGYFTPDYRLPHILRYLLTSLGDRKLSSDHLREIVAVPDLDLLRGIVKNEGFPKRIHQLFQKIASCFIEEQPIRKKMPELSTAAFGSGAVLTQTFKDKYPQDYDEVAESSLVLIRELPSSEHTIIFPKLPELIAFYCIEPISDIIINNMKDMDSTLRVQYFTDLLFAVPLSDIVGTGVLLNISTRDPELFTSLIKGLRSVEPKTETIKKGTQIMMHMEDVGHIRIDFDSDFDIEESSFIADSFPYSVLSQLAGYPMEAEFSGQDAVNDMSSYNFHLKFILQIASDPHLLLRADVRSFQNMKFYENYDWNGVGQIVNGKEGIIEAIVQSIQKCFSMIPNEMTLLYEYGFMEKNFNLLYRFYLALRSLIFRADEDIAQRAKTYIKKFHVFFTDYMAEYLSRDAASQQEHDDLYDSLKKLKIEDHLDQLLLGNDHLSD